MKTSSTRTMMRVLMAMALVLMLTLIGISTASAAVWTDEQDYTPGSVVTLSGDNRDNAGYQLGETVVVSVSGPNGYAATCSATVNPSGAWSCQVTLSSDSSAVGTYAYTATGQISHVSQNGTFTDASNTENVNFDTSGLPAGTSVNVSYSGTNPGGNSQTGTSTFIAPGPSSATGFQGSSVLYCTFPASITVGSSTYNLKSQPCGTNGMSLPAASSPTHTTTITGAYELATPANSAPTVSNINGDTTANEGDTKTYSVTATDSDGDTLTYAWSITSGNATIPGASNGSSVDVEFTDGPSTVGLQVVVGDGHIGHDVTKTLSITESNVKPTPSIDSLTGNSGVMCIGGNVVTLDFSWVDPAGTNDTYSYDVDWGDGPSHATGSNATSPVTGLTHSYAVGGPYKISVTVNDEDPGSGNKVESSAFSFLYKTSSPFFLPPIKPDGTAAFKLGSTVPIKFQLFDCNNHAVPNAVNTLSIIYWTSAQSDDQAAVYDSGSSNDNGNLFRYDPTSQQYIFNWSTKGLPSSYTGTYKVVVTLDDKTSQTGSFSLKK